MYGILFVLSRCCFHHLVDNSILYKKKIYSTFTWDQYFFQKIKSYSRWSAAKLTVKFYLVPGVRNRKFYLAPGMRNGQIYLVPNDSYEKFYLAVKGLRDVKLCIHIKRSAMQYDTLYSESTICKTKYSKGNVKLFSVIFLNIWSNILFIQWKFIDSVNISIYSILTTSNYLDPTSISKIWYQT